MSSFVTKHSKQRKTPKVIKIQWLESIWCRIGKNVEFYHKTFKTTQNSKSDQNTMTCIDLMSQKSFVTKHSKQRKTTKSIKLRWIAYIWRRIGKNVEFCHKTFKTTQNSKSDQNTMTLHRFDVKMIKTTQNYQSDQITMNCMHLTSNWQKCRVLSQNIQNNAKLQKWSKYNDLHRFDVKMIKTTQNYQSDQITMNCIHLTSNWQKCRVLSQNIQNNAKLQKWSKYNDLNRFDVELAKMSSFVTKHSKQRKTPKVIKLQWLCIDLMSKWSKQRKTTKSIKLRWIASIWRRIGKNVEFCHKTFKTTQNSKSDQNTMTCIDLMLAKNDQNNAKLPNRSNYDELHTFDVELAKMSSFVTKHSKQRKTPKVIKIQWLESIWCRIGKNVEFCHKTFKTTQNSKSDQNTMTLHRFDVKMIKTTQNYQIDQITMNCIDLTSNWQKCRVLSQNIQNNAKLQKWSKYNDLHRFDVKMIKTTQNYQIDQITMNCMHLTSNLCRVLSQNIQNNAKLQKWSKYNDLNRFDVELSKMSSFIKKHSKQRKTPKVIKIQWLESIWCRIRKNVEFCHKTFKTTQNYQIDQITMNCMHLTSNWQKCRVLSQNIQNNAKLQKWSKYNDLNRFDVEFAKMSSFVTKHSKQRKTTKAIKLRWIAYIWRRIVKNVEFCHKTFKTTQNSKSDQNTMTWIDLMSNWQKCRVLSQNIQNNAKLPKRSNYDELHAFDVELAKMSSFVTKHSKQRNTPKVIKIQWLESIWCRIRKNVEFCHKTFKTTQNSKSDQNTMTCIDLMLKWSKQRKTTKSIKLRWIACIWRRIGKNVEFCHKTFKTTQNSKSDQNTMTWIDLMSNWQKCRVLSQNIQNNAKLQKWSKYNDLNRFDVELAKMSSFVTKHSKQRKTPKVIKIHRWCQNCKIPKRFDCMHLTSNWQKCRVLSQNIQNNAKLQKWSKYNDLHRFDVKMIKTTQNYQIDQITMNCIHLTSNWQKCRVLSQNIQNNAKLQKWSKYNDLNRFDVELAKMSSFVTKHSKQRKTPKVIKIQWLESIWCRIGKNVEFCHKTFKTTQNSKSDQNTMTWIDLMSNWQKCRVLSQNIQNNAKLPNRSNYDELHAFDVELAKMSSFVTKHSKQRKTPKVIKIQWLESIWCRIRKNVEFCHKTFKTTQNSKSDQSTMTLHRFDVKMIKTTQNYQIDQITMNCIDLTSNWQKCRVLSQNIQNNAKLQKWSKYNDLNRFDVELIKNVEFWIHVEKHSKQRKTPKVIKSIWCRITSFVTKHSKQRKMTMTLHRFDVKMIKTTQNYQIDQITMNCIDLTSNWQKCRVLSQNIQNNAKLQKWSKYNDLNRFDVELAKMSSFVTKHSKQRKTPKVIKIQWLASIWC